MRVPTDLVPLKMGQNRQDGSAGQSFPDKLDNLSPIPRSHGRRELTPEGHILTHMTPRGGNKLCHWQGEMRTRS